MINFNKALKHLKKDKVFSKIISKFSTPDFKEGKDYFSALVRSIIHQQLSGKSAVSIERKFKTLFGRAKMTPKNLLNLNDAQFKSAGISPQKKSYLQDLSKKFLDGSVNPKNFHKMTDEDIRLHLISVKGVGRWTADMFLMFTLVRPDVLPTGDLGIQKGFKKIFNMKNLPKPEKMEKLALSWKPYRTTASWYLWKIADEDK